MMIRRLAVLPFLMLPFLMLPMLALAQEWAVDPAQSTLGFSGSYQGEAFEGLFKRFNAAIRYDPADLSHARFDVYVDLASVDTRSSERDDTLTGSDFFDTGTFPKAHFVTRSFSKAADGQVSAAGTLSLHGINQPVTLKVDFKPAANGATLNVRTQLDRLAFKLGAGADWKDISRMIEVHARLRLVGR